MGSYEGADAEMVKTCQDNYDEADAEEVADSDLMVVVRFGWSLNKSGEGGGGGLLGVILRLVIGRSDPWPPDESADGPDRNSGLKERGIGALRLG